MTLPPVIRVFFAIDLSPEIKEKVGAFIATLKKKSKTNAIRWSRPENLHITLQFLAEVKSEHIAQLIAKVKKSVEGALKPSRFSLGEVYLFPNPFRPRVIVLEVMPQEELAALSDLIGHGILAAEYEIETKPFRAHLTLGRIKHTQGVNLNFLTDAKPELDALDLKEIVLFRSEPHPEGSTYSVMERIAL